jgi:NADPH2:quinone reductase
VAQAAGENACMKAIWMERNGGAEVLAYAERPDPNPGPGELLVDLAAAGVNFRDIYERRGGGYGSPAPCVPGIEGAGTVSAVGEGATQFKPGDRVGWTNGPGSYAERAVVRERAAVPLPEGISDEVAAAVLLQGMTAHYLCTSTYPVQPGDWVGVHAAAGGVGLLLTQMVKLRGGNVVATTSGGEKAELARGAGADEVVGYGEFLSRAKDVTNGAGVVAVYDGVGAATFDDGLDSLRVRGYMVVFGASSGPMPPVEGQRLAAKGLFLTRPSLVHYTATRDELLWRASEVFDWIEQGKLDVRIGGRYLLEDARQAHNDLEKRRTTGKLLLLPRGR